MARKIISYIAHQCAVFIELQLFITIISLPLLIAWGLPISLLSLCGNFFFAPFLTAFLILSSFIFCCELLHIPSNWFIYMLEYVTDTWTYLMSIGSPYYLIGYAKQPWWFLATLPCCVVILLHHKKITMAWQRISCSVGLLLLFSLTAWMWPTSKECFTIIKNKEKSVSVLHLDRSAIVVDGGAMGRYISSPSWVEYHFIPELIHLTGSTHIDHLIVTKPGKLLFDSITMLCSSCSIGTLYVPVWSGEIPSRYWKSFFQLKELAHKYGITIKRIRKNPVAIEILCKNQTIIIDIIPKNTEQRAGHFNYYPFSVHALIDKKVIPLYDPV